MTEAPTSYIMGWGIFALPADKGLDIILQEAYYCKEAKGTLISLAGLLKAGADCSFKGKDLLIQVGLSKLKSKYTDHKWLVKLPSQSPDSIPPQACM
ncbi:hypothetical protein CROQUDRAFT_91833 [Cronartium quercuum f. sp. fusiforme G11]|uniref:Uncharacterized protein n=1 Tax=Cronartium quercuum f. sp. fusiforme G11 TaxID=708437 RepID=A0A9P6NMU4_9BASI|nr:hypothetical protein CROQUDRAFT_91833 [Cronartium quercuum f. sp. fusiforme G11]